MQKNFISLQFKWHIILLFKLEHLHILEGGNVSQVNFIWNCIVIMSWHARLQIFNIMQIKRTYNNKTMKMSLVCSYFCFGEMIIYYYYRKVNRAYNNTIINMSYHISIFVWGNYFTIIIVYYYSIFNQVQKIVFANFKLFVSLNYVQWFVMYPVRAIVYIDIENNSLNG